MPLNEQGKCKCAHFLWKDIILKWSHFHRAEIKKIIKILTQRLTQIALICLMSLILQAEE